MNKKCFKCGLFKSLDEFYSHPKMQDGHLGKCKDCTKSDTKNRIAKVKNNPDWIAKERARCREKSKRARANGTAKKATYAVQNAWRKRNRLKHKAHNIAAYALRSGILKKASNCSDCGRNFGKLHKHHEDYTKPIDIVWLCPACHGMRHRKPIFI